MKTVQWMVRAALLGVACVGACDGGAAKSGARPADASTVARERTDVVELSAADARDRMVKGTLTARELTQAYLDRIAQIDDAGPRLDAVIELSPRALADAEALDAERRAGKVRGALHGIPVLIKDNIDVAGMVNSAGSLALADHRPKEDAFLVARLRAAGAVILGKTNLSEWANFRSTRATSGWSSRGGQTKNPYVLDRNPCGSSSGAGTAIAASLGAIGVGTETDGSIICPSAVNGLVGLKPTVGLVSRSGIIPISISQDTAGPMARTVTDAALLLSALAAVDPADPAAPKEGGLPTDYTTFLKPGALKGKRLGVLRQAMGYHPDVDRAAEASLTTLRAQGAEVVDVEMATYHRWDNPELTVMLYEFKDGLNAYLRRSGAPHASLSALIAWNEAHAETVMPFFGQELFEKAAALGPLTDAEYLEARESARRLAGKEGLLAILDGGKLDAVVAPSMAPAWLTDHVLGDHFVGESYAVAAVAGTPSITVPMGDSHGLPLGFVFMGRAYSEGELLGMAFAFEQSTKARRAPAFEPTLRR
ncbi:amidase [Polyangium jinanense]|uniref:Amidase n=1 Tax=Polyangium jinanense TaxID=2829994 RepID=A0A9X3WZS6_9BACT|nr:amidase [Polyangium jinanense]MDC3954797.1 amidase [Polyangium jinanense]MDC3981432.1 amidase [Polyangium jinanense]